MGANSSVLFKASDYFSPKYWPAWCIFGLLRLLSLLLEGFPSEDELADANLINRSIEKYVCQFPDTYLWIHQRFKTRPPGEASFYP
jgi:lauroyl/myristoyl acyltransferase